MEELLIQIGELIAMEMDQVKEVHYLDKDTGFVCKLVLADDREVVLNLI